MYSCWYLPNYPREELTLCSLCMARTMLATDLTYSHAPPSILHFFFVLLTTSIILSTTDGSLNVLVSPSESSSPLKILRKIRRMILPDLVLGRSSTMKMA